MEYIIINSFKYFPYDLKSSSLYYLTWPIAISTLKSIKHSKSQGLLYFLSAIIWQPQEIFHEPMDCLRVVPFLNSVYSHLYLKSLHNWLLAALSLGPLAWSYLRFGPCIALIGQLYCSTSLTFRSLGFVWKRLAILWFFVSPQYGKYFSWIWK